MKRRQIGGVAVLLSGGLIAALVAQSADRVPAVHEFHERIEAYLKLRKKLEASTGKQKPTDSPAVIAGRTQQLAAKLRAARAGVRQGNTFTPTVAAEFRRLIGITMQSKDADLIRASLKSAEPVTLRLGVNDLYPGTAPLPSTPPTLLLNLPQLPKDLDYRVVGRTLILRDVGANLILDVITDLEI